MQTLTKTFAVFTLIASLIGCSTSPKTQVAQIGDNSLSREAIMQELAKLDRTEKEIEKNKGVTVTNVASVLFWWPGIVYTYFDANTAEKSIEQRRSHLSAIFDQKYSNNAPSDKA